MISSVRFSASNTLLPSVAAKQRQQVAENNAKLRTRLSEWVGRVQQGEVKVNSLKLTTCPHDQLSEDFTIQFSLADSIKGHGCLLKLKKTNGKLVWAMLEDFDSVPKAMSWNGRSEGHHAGVLTNYIDELGSEGISSDKDSDIGSQGLQFFKMLESKLKPEPDWSVVERHPMEGRISFTTPTEKDVVLFKLLNQWQEKMKVGIQHVESIPVLVGTVPGLEISKFVLTLTNGQQHCLEIKKRDGKLQKVMLDDLQRQADCFGWEAGKPNPPLAWSPSKLTNYPDEYGGDYLTSPFLPLTAKAETFLKKLVETVEATQAVKS